ncbi:MAG: hypothetical protein FJX75_00365 [Armatimonadetes bacterium]|nr:hypothetical protein [Armatimonadota bacterium]
MSKGLILNDDGWSTYTRHPAPMGPRDIERVTVDPQVGTSVVAYQFCALGGHAVNYRSTFLPRVGDMMQRIDTLHVWRMRETLRHLDELGTDPLWIVSEACHRHGIACQFSLRMNDAHHVYRKADGSPYFPELLSSWFDAHPDALLPTGQLDYAHPDVHEYRLAQIAEVLGRYEVDGIDLDFTRFRPWFRQGEERARAPLMTDLVRRLRDLVGPERTLSARFEYSAGVCIASGLDVEHWLAEGLLNQITLGGIGDHTPDAPSDWWVERAHAKGCKVYPGMEGQLHWIASCGSGGTGLRAGNGVVDGFGPPSIEYMRAVAALHYMSGADGVSLFNFTCADGPWDQSALTELADPDALRLADKQYVLAVWPPDAQIYNHEWVSRFRLDPGETEASYPLRIADDLAGAARCGVSPSALLTLDLKGVNRLDDIEVSINGLPLQPDSYRYNHYDHGCWNGVVQYDVPPQALRRGDNALALRRLREYVGFEGALEVRKCVLEIGFGQ